MILFFYLQHKTIAFCEFIQRPKVSINQEYTALLTNRLIWGKGGKKQKSSEKSTSLIALCVKLIKISKKEPCFLIG